MLQEVYEAQAYHVTHLTLVMLWSRSQSYIPHTTAALKNYFIVKKVCLNFLIDNSTRKKFFMPLTFSLSQKGTLTMTLHDLDT